MRALYFLALLTALWIGVRAPVLINEFGAVLLAFESRARVVLRHRVTVRALSAQPAPAALTAPSFNAAPVSPPLAAVAVSAVPAVARIAPAGAQFAGVTHMVSMVVGAGETGFRLGVHHSARGSRSPPVAGDIAQAAYDSLAMGDRRAAAAGFETAAALDADDVRAAAWLREAAKLGRRWSGSGYIFARRAGPPGFASAALLGGGQSGATLAFTPMPLATRPLSVTLRGAVAHDGLGINGASAQGAVGVGWQVFKGIALSGEGLIASGYAAASGWTARLSGGEAGHLRAVEWNGYGEVGLVNANPYASGQGFVGWRMPVEGVQVVAGGGVWGAAQYDGATVKRLDLGPSLRFRMRKLPVDLIVDYRVRIAGNAAPGTGFAVTLSGYF